MKIQSIELFKVPPRWLFLKITTDTGLSGWGEPVIEGRADTVAAPSRNWKTISSARMPAGLKICGMYCTVPVFIVAAPS